MPRKPIPKKPRSVVDSRVTSDGWKNVLTGLGTARDKRESHSFGVDSVTTDRSFQEELWQGDDLFARIVEAVPDEMMRAGFDISTDVDADPPAEEIPQDVNQDAFGPPPVAAAPPQKPPAEFQVSDDQAFSKGLLARYEELEGDTLFLEAQHYENAYGGGAIVLGVDDGRNLMLPVNEERIKTFSWGTVLTPRELQAVQYYGDPYAPNYGKPEIYRIYTEILPTLGIGRNANTKAATVLEIHESRLIVFPGISVSRMHRVQNQGWGDSKLTRCFKVLSDFQMAFAASAHILNDFSQATMKIKGMAELLATNDDDTIIKRARLIDITRSIARMVIIDADEEYKRETSALTGLPEMLQAFEHRLCAAADMPAALLFGRSPSGLNASGDSDIRFFYDRVRARQQRCLKPRMEKFIRYMMLAKDGPTGGNEPPDWSIKFRPLWQPTDKEQADTRYVVAQSDNLYINNGTLVPEEVAASRFGGRTWSGDTKVDMALRKEMATTFEAEKAAMPQPGPTGSTGPTPVKQPMQNARAR